MKQQSNDKKEYWEFQQEMEREAMHIQKVKTYGLIFLGAMLMLLAAFIFVRLT